MKNLILFDSAGRESLLPLTFYRPVSEIRVGILTISEKWEKRLNGKAGWLTVDYLSRKYPLTIAKDNLFIAGEVLPTAPLIDRIEALLPMQGLVCRGKLIAARIPGEQFPPSHTLPVNDLDLIEIEEVDSIEKPADIFLKNEAQIVADFELLIKRRSSMPVPAHVQVFGDKEQIFIEEGAEVLGLSLNTSAGPVYIGRKAKIMEGSMLRGPVAIGSHAVIKMGAKIYKGTTIGPHCKVGGEISNCVFFGYSNKGHDGYLGNSVVAEWCNFGAGTNASNLKNNYSKIKVWSYPEKKPVPTSLIFHGLIMADFSRCSINTMFNTGTVVGVNANVLAGRFPPKFIPSFTWDTGQGRMEEYDPAKAIQTAEVVMNRRQVPLDETTRSIMEHIFRLTKEYRKAL